MMERRSRTGYEKGKYNRMERKSDGQKKIFNFFGSSHDTRLFELNIIIIINSHLVHCGTGARQFNTRKIRKFVEQKKTTTQKRKSGARFHLVMRQAPRSPHPHHGPG